MRILISTIVLLSSVCAAVAQEETDTPFGESFSGAAEQSAVPVEVSEAVWKAIDVNADGRATDREAYAAVKPVRILANARDASPLRDALRKFANTDDQPIVSAAEALGVIAAVRGQRCPTAKRAKHFFDELDTDDSGTLEGGEMQAALKPLGNVGRALFQPVGVTVKSMDLNDNNVIEANEIYLSANAMMRVQLATQGPGIAQRDPSDWLKFVSAVAYMDSDADNIVSPREARQVTAIAAQFGNIDRNKDQQITAGEMCEFQSQLDLAAYINSSSVGGS